MKATIFAAAALTSFACAQDLDFAAVINAPKPSEISPPLAAASASTSVANEAAVSASIAAQVAPTTAQVTGAAASAAATQDPSPEDLQKRFFFDPFWWLPKTTLKTTTKKAEPTKWPQTTEKKTEKAPPAPTGPTGPAPPPATTQPTSTEQQTTGTTTQSADTSCPTTPEDGTYCGFINPEDPCAVQPDGYGPKVQPDTVEAFKNYQPFHDEANNAITPSGYEQKFKDLYASVSGNSYITFHTLKSYDVQQCAQICDDTELCTAFNIYIERDPSLNPTTNATNPEFNCPLPSSITNYKCSLWGSSISQDDATNEGGYRGDFQVVIAGSNGYDKTEESEPVPPPNWDKPSKCDGGAISHGDKYHLGSKFFPGPFNPKLCSVYAEAQTQKNRDAAKHSGQHSYTPCNMFNAYMVKLNNKAQGTYCSLYDTVLSPKWAGYKGSQSAGFSFSVEYSWTFGLKNQDKGEW